MKLNSNTSSPESGFSELHSHTNSIIPEKWLEIPKKYPDINFVLFNERNNCFVYGDNLGLATWKPELYSNDTQSVCVAPDIRRCYSYPKYHYNLFASIAYSAYFNVYFAITRDANISILNRDFIIISELKTPEIRNSTRLLINKTDNTILILGSYGLRIWDYKKLDTNRFQEIKAMSNYSLVLKREYKHVGGIWLQEAHLVEEHNWIFCCSMNDISCYNLESEQRIAHFINAHQSCISKLLFSKHLQILISATKIGEIKLWHLHFGHLHTLNGHVTPIVDLCFSPMDPSQMLSVSRDGSLHLWSLYLGQSLTKIDKIFPASENLSVQNMNQSIKFFGPLQVVASHAANRILFVGTSRRLLLLNFNYFSTIWFPIGSAAVIDRIELLSQFKAVPKLMDKTEEQESLEIIDVNEGVNNSHHDVIFERLENPDIEESKMMISVGNEVEEKVNDNIKAEENCNCHEVQLRADRYNVIRKPRMISLNCQDGNLKLGWLNPSQSAQSLNVGGKARSTILSPPKLSPLNTLLDQKICLGSDFAYILLNSTTLMVYVIGSDPACNVANWDIEQLQKDILARQERELDMKQRAKLVSRALHSFLNGHSDVTACEYVNPQVGIAKCSSIGTLHCVANQTTQNIRKDGEENRKNAEADSNVFGFHFHKILNKSGLNSISTDSMLLIGLTDGRILFMHSSEYSKIYFEMKLSMFPILEIRQSKDCFKFFIRSRNKETGFVSVYKLPQMRMVHKVYFPFDISDFCVKLTAKNESNFCPLIITAHSSGHLYFHDQNKENLGVDSSKASYFTRLQQKPDHATKIVQIDLIEHSKNIHLMASFSTDGTIKIWNLLQRIVLAEVYIEESISAGCFLPFNNHHSKNNKNDDSIDEDVTRLTLSPPDLLIASNGHVVKLALRQIFPPEAFHSSKVRRPHSIKTSDDNQMVSDKRDDEVSDSISIVSVCASETESMLLEEPAVKYDGRVKEPPPLTMDAYMNYFGLELGQNLMEKFAEMEKEALEMDEEEMGKFAQFAILNQLDDLADEETVTEAEEAEVEAGDEVGVAQYEQQGKIIDDDDEAGEDADEGHDEEEKEDDLIQDGKIDADKPEVGDAGEDLIVTVDETNEKMSKDEKEDKKFKFEIPVFERTNVADSLNAIRIGDKELKASERKTKPPFGGAAGALTPFLPPGNASSVAAATTPGKKKAGRSSDTKPQKRQKKTAASLDKQQSIRKSESTAKKPSQQSGGNAKASPRVGGRKDSNAGRKSLAHIVERDSDYEDESSSSSSSSKAKKKNKRRRQKKPRDVEEEKSQSSAEDEDSDNDGVDTAKARQKSSSKTTDNIEKDGSAKPQLGLAAVSKIKIDVGKPIKMKSNLLFRTSLSKQPQPGIELDKNLEEEEEQADQDAPADEEKHQNASEPLMHDEHVSDRDVGDPGYDYRVPAGHQKHFTSPMPMLQQSGLNEFNSSSAIMEEFVGTTQIMEDERNTAIFRMLNAAGGPGGSGETGTAANSDQLNVMMMRFLQGLEGADTGDGRSGEGTLAGTFGEFAAGLGIHQIHNMMMIRGDTNEERTQFKRVFLEKINFQELMDILRTNSELFVRQLEQHVDSSQQNHMHQTRHLESGSDKELSGDSGGHQCENLLRIQTRLRHLMQQIRASSPLHQTSASAGADLSIKHQTRKMTAQQQRFAAAHASNTKSYLDILQYLLARINRLLRHVSAGQRRLRREKEQQLRIDQHNQRCHNLHSQQQQRSVTAKPVLHRGNCVSSSMSTSKKCFSLDRSLENRPITAATFNQSQEYRFQSPCHKGALSAASHHLDSPSISHHSNSDNCSCLRCSLLKSQRPVSSIPSKHLIASRQAEAAAQSSGQPGNINSTNLTGIPIDIFHAPSISEERLIRQRFPQYIKRWIPNELLLLQQKPWMNSLLSGARCNHQNAFL